MINIFDTHNDEVVRDRVLANLYALGAHWQGGSNSPDVHRLFNWSEQRYIYVRGENITRDGEDPNTRSVLRGVDYVVHDCAWMGGEGGWYLLDDEPGAWDPSDTTTW